jgi:hypothetical protein
MNYEEIKNLEEAIIKDNKAVAKEDHRKVWNKLINAIWKHSNPESLN